MTQIWAQRERLQQTADMSVATPSAGPRLASRPSPAGPSRPVAARPVAARPTAPRPAPRPTPGSTSATSVKSAASTSGGRAPAPSVPPGGSNAIVPAGGGKDTSSSAGKVFARPSKEWVLPERAKPGRKVSVEEPDSVSSGYDSIVSGGLIGSVGCMREVLTQAETAISEPPLPTCPPRPTYRLHCHPRRAYPSIRKRRDPFECPITRSGQGVEGG